MSDSPVWADATLAAALFAVDPAGLGGVALRAPAGPVREQWLALQRGLLGAGVAQRRLPLHIRDERLLGGLDLTATLQAGRPVAQRGLLAEVDGGVLLVAMAERLPAATAARLASVIDRGEVVVERDGVAQRHATRFGVVALDEGMNDDEQVPAALLDRLALHLNLGEVAPRDATAIELEGALSQLALARALLPRVSLPDAPLQALCAAALALGVASLRPVLMAARLARAHAALFGREEVEADDAAVAARLVLAPRASILPLPQEPAPEEAAEPEPPSEQLQEPPPEPEPPADPSPPPDADTDPPPEPPQPGLPEGALDDVILQAALAALPPGTLARLKAEQAAQMAGRAAGKAGTVQKSGQRGRPAGVRRGEPRGALRLNVIETLRAAAPWQKLRRQAAGRDVRPGAVVAASGKDPLAVTRIEVRAEDFHVSHFKQRRETTTIFAVDASGSAALARLAEAKGAVELLLADCYVRRDRVAVIAFRGRAADLLLPPTRSLVRAKRALAGLPGGGGTPLATAIDAAALLADGIRRRGDTPVVVLLTDGRANVALDGSGGRVQAEADALAAARRLRLAGASVLLIDTSPRPHAQAARLAAEMRATYLPLPQAGPQALSQVVRATSVAAATARG